MSGESIVAIIGALAALLVGFVNARTSASRAELDSMRATVKTLSETVVSLQSENKRLLAENVALHETVSKLECENDDLRNRLDELERRRGKRE